MAVSVFGPVPSVREVRAAQSWDLQARYTGFSGWQLAAGIRNLLDQQPPFSQTTSFQFGFNPQVASPLGGVFFGARPLLVQVTRIAIARATT